MNVGNVLDRLVDCMYGLGKSIGACKTVLQVLAVLTANGDLAQTRRILSDSGTCRWLMDKQY